ncbi:glycosyltransferase [Phocaeicola sp.]|uniref:glycosyltransferase n=1 Tax=Phocaeicola sp. TaxID=2773926 RepID=UPI0023D4933F|nr:glycosyltransferase [Phocaeicola sp.]MDE5678593.1 glycosyltransferase [Phocaeicola sp.]
MLGKKHSYISRVPESEKWVLISYLPEVFYHQDNPYYMKVHQNRYEMIRINKVFNKLGYNTLIVSYNSTVVPENLNVKIVFGIEPAFVHLSQMYPDAYKIYYATGAYFKHQNGMIKKRTDEFNKYFNVNLPYRRMVQEHNSVDIADCILQIGSQFTLKTYPEKYRQKITIIDQSSMNFQKAIQRILKPTRNYIWLGSSGNVLKGLDLVLNFFISNPQYTLYIVGPMEEEFKKIYSKSITHNIHLCGFVNMDSCRFMEIAANCNFLIYPSASEGMPGSVINLMKLGVIPILSEWASVDDIKSLGFILNDLDIQSISMAVDWCNSLSDEEINRLSKKCSVYATKKYSIDNFEKQFETFISRISTHLYEN